MLLLGGAIALIFSSVRRGSQRYLLGAALVTLIADVIYAQQLSNGTYTDGAWLDAGWMIAYIIWGFAGLHSTTPDELPTERPQDSQATGGDTRRRLAVRSTFC